MSNWQQLFHLRFHIERKRCKNENIKYQFMWACYQQNIMRPLILSILLTTFILNGCGGSSSQSEFNSIDFINGRTWGLTSYSEVNNGPTLAVSGYTLQFALFRNDNRLSGFDGCNSFETDQLNVDAERDHISLTDTINIGDRFCEELQFSEYLVQFDFFYTFLSSPFNFDVDFVERELFLTLTLDNGSVMEFSDVASDESI